MSTFSIVPILDISPDPNQPRKFFDEQAITELTASIITHGVIQPILVRTTDTPDKYMLVCGERRFKASIEAAMSDIPCIIKTMTDEEALEVQIIENLQRRDVHPMEEAIAIEQLIKTYTQEEISSRLGKSIKYVGTRLKLTSLSELAQDCFYKNRMTLKTAVILASIDAVSQDEVINNRIKSIDTDNDNWTLNNIDYLVEQKLREFRSSIFDTDDADLYPAAGACTSCIHNSSNTPTLFDNKKPSCTNSPCFEIKRLKHLTNILEANPDMNVIVRDYHWSNGDYYKPIQPMLKNRIVYTDRSVSILEPDEPLMTPQEWDEWECFFDADDNIDYDSPEFLEDYNLYVDAWKTSDALFQEQLKTWPQALYIDHNLVVSIIGATPAVASSTVSTATDGGELSNELQKLEDKEKRACQLDAEKLYKQVMASLLEPDSAHYIGKWIESDKGEKLWSNTMYSVASAMLYEALGWQERSTYCIEILNEKYPNTDKLNQHFFVDGADYYHLLRLFIISSMPRETQYVSVKSYASMILAKHLHPEMVTYHENDIKAKAEKRLAIYQSKIKSLS
jgi:ParB family chromosome partitioning protein